MDFRVLGSLQISVADQPVVVSTAPKRQLALAVLLARAGQPVSVDTLVEAIWGQRPPASARRNLQLYVHGFRRIFGDGLIATRGNGYMLGLGDNLDSIRFRRLAADGAAALDAGDPAAATTALRAALDLWRGPAFAEFLDCELVAQEAAGLELLRLETFERWAEAQLATGATPRLAAELTELCRLHPYRESLRALLMRALYQTGRRVEALTVFRQTRALLVDEVGVEPGLPLQRLHEAMLRGDEALAPALKPDDAAPVTSTTAPPHPPRQLPAPPQMFTGRFAELAALDQVHDGSTVVITAIDGMAGIGKTALAVHAAHQLAVQYPDGQLFIDLHGYTQGMEPIEPAEALDRMLRALGIPGTQIPAGIDERAALYRTRIAGRRMLIVLDNAATEAQVAPLLPGTPGCLVLVTSRRLLAGLDHTRTLPLDTLPVPEAVALFTHTAGTDSLADQPPTLLREVVELCGLLPLAIRIAAARLRLHPSWSVNHLVELLRDQRHRLAQLAVGQRSVTAALDLSYQELDPDQQRVYRLLGLHPGPELDAYSAATLLDTTPQDASRALDQLLEAHLLQEPTLGRYRFHDLTRAHAVHTATRDETKSTRDAALERLLDYYLHTASAAMNTAYPYEHQHRPQVPPARTHTREMRDPAEALEWLDTEQPDLLAVARHAVEHGWPAHILHLSTILHRHLRTRGRYHDAETLHQQALATARATSDQASEAAALTRLGHIRSLQGRHEQAANHYEQVLRLTGAAGHRIDELEALAGLGQVHRLQGKYEQAADHLGRALQMAHSAGHRIIALEALAGIGEMYSRQGRYAQATDYLERALQLARVTGYRTGELGALADLGLVHWRRGQYSQTVDRYQQALQVARAIGHRAGELSALNGLAHVNRALRRYAQATDHYQQVLQFARATGHRVGELSALNGLAHVNQAQGRYQQASDCYRHVLALAQESGDRNFEFEAQQGLGRLEHATGKAKAAIAHHEQALALACDLDQPVDQARAHDGLAHAHHAMNQHRQARTHWQQALGILTDFGVDHTEDEETTPVAIRAHLAGLADASDATSLNR